MDESRSPRLFQDPWFQYEDHLKNISYDHNEKSTSSSSTSSIGEDSDASNGSSITSSEIADDASSSASANSSLSGGVLYDLSDIMEQLPIKRGLSQFYKGKSESFTSLSRATSIEDLAKKATPYRRNLKASKSCGNGLHSYRQYTLPKATIAKKATRVSSLSSFPSKRGSVMNSKPPLSPLHQNFEC